jgi:hypothetical protein
MTSVRGSALTISLVVTVGISLLCLSLLLTTAGLTRGGGDTLRHRALVAADRCWVTAVDGLSRARSGPSRELRRLALPGSFGLSRSGLKGNRWMQSEGGPGISVELSQPRFVDLSRPGGTDLRVFNQEGFFVERYALSSVAGGKRLKEPARIEIELESAISDADTSWLPPPDLP